MTKTVSTRITNRTHEKLVEQCNKIGCTVSEYLNGTIELGLTGSTRQDLGDVMDKVSESQPDHAYKAETGSDKPTPVRVTKVSYDDGKTWIPVEISIKKIPDPII